MTYISSLLSPHLSCSSLNGSYPLCISSQKEQNAQTIQSLQSQMMFYREVIHLIHKGGIDAINRLENLYQRMVSQEKLREKDIERFISIYKLTLAPHKTSSEPFTLEKALLERSKLERKLLRICHVKIIRLSRVILLDHNRKCLECLSPAHSSRSRRWSVP